MLGHLPRSKRRPVLLSLPAIGLAALALVDVAGAAPGDLDSTFGIGGKVLTDFGGISEIANAVAVQPDGKIVAAGFRLADVAGHLFSDFAVARYNAYAVAVQPDGKIVVAGRSDAIGGLANNSDFALARYNIDGC